MVNVKVCGLTRVADVAAALESGADALGFVFEPSSPRYIGENLGLLSFLSELRIKQPLVAVFGECPGFVDPSFRLVQATKFTGATLGMKFLTVRPTPGFDLAACRAEAEAEQVVALVVDAYHPDRAGGTGELVDFDFAKKIVQDLPFPVFLAGGLNPDNVAEAIRYVAPYGVDASSGLESSPGVKDPALIQAFVEAAKNA